MGAIFGFGGPRNDAHLERLERASMHRGRGRRQASLNTLGSLAYRPSGQVLNARTTAGGLVANGDDVLAMAGFFTGWNEGPSPTLERLLAELGRRGPSAFTGLRGAFVIAARLGGQIHLLRDGAGARTLYWSVFDQRLIFAIEPKVLLAYPGMPRRMRPAAIAQYLTFSFIPGASTMLEDVFELLPGHRLEWRRDHSPEVRRVFDFEAVAKEEGRSTVEWIEEFSRLHRLAVQDRLPDAPQPISATLSGGIDSSVVVAEAHRLGASKMRTFTIHFGSKYHNELDFARQVAERVGTDHHEICVRPRSFLRRLRRMVWHLDEQIGDPITMPNFEVARQIATFGPWVLNGEGGDPLFGGPKNLTMLLHHWYGGLSRTRYWREQAYLASYRRAYDSLDSLLTPEWRAQYDRHEALEGLLTPFFETERPAGFVDKLMAINIRLKGAHLILPKVERMMAAAGLVSLSPLFDERLIELSFRMPSRLKLDRGSEKVILKLAYREQLPGAVVDRPKAGMAVPVHFWFRGELKRYARRILNPRGLKRQGIFDPNQVRRLLAYDTEEGPGRYGIRIWMLLTFEIWRRLVIEGEAI